MGTEFGTKLADDIDNFSARELPITRFGVYCCASLGALAAIPFSEAIIPPYNPVPNAVYSLIMSACALNSDSDERIQVSSKVIPLTAKLIRWIL